MTAINELKQKFSDTETSILLEKWSEGTLLEWAETILRDELMKRGFSESKLAEFRVSKSISTPRAGSFKRSSSLATRDALANYASEQSASNITTNASVAKTVGTSRFVVSAVAFIALFGIQLHIAFQFVPAIPTGKQFDDFMLLSMGMAFLPLIFILIVVMFVIMLMGLIAFFFSRACWKLLGTD